MRAVPRPKAYPSVGTDTHTISRGRLPKPSQQATLQPGSESKPLSAAAKLWGITDDELKAIQEALAEAGKSKRAAQDNED